ncbi:MAG: ATP-binding protein [Deltaproteobacteria bacterium]|nr:ATP-binding protein [Deltaproteobacteria bacterium]
MERTIDSELLLWKESRSRSVLLVRGARQVGKTYSIRKLSTQFAHLAEVNFEEDLPVGSFFKDSLNPAGIIEKLSAYYDVPIVKGDTLLFFDEIQACPDALRSLRFFHEKMPELHVVAAGSLLEFTLAEIPSFGVGRITNLFMYPMTFNEFLTATQGKALSTVIAKASLSDPIDHAIHKKLLDRFRVYQMLGGMPAVVEAYRSGSDLRTCQNVIDGLLTSFRDDFAKYKKRSPVMKLQEVFESVVYQAGRKFKYSNVSSTGNSQGYKDALELLVKAGLVYKVHHSSARGVPLGAQMNPNKFKAIVFDLGIHQRILGLDISDILIEDDIQLINKGSLAECFVGLELIAHSSPRLHPSLYYWHREARASNAEVDYVIQLNEEVVPVEVKAGTKGQMQSMAIFIKERDLEKGIRLSHENFAKFGNIQIIPIYAVSRLRDI